MAAKGKMRLRAGLVMTGLGAIALAAGLAVGARAADAPETSPGTAIAIMQASAAVQSGDCAAAKAPLNQLWNDPYLETSDPQLAGQFHAALIACTAQTDGLKAAIALSAENIKRPTANIAAYDLHIFLLVMDNQGAAAAATMNAALDRFPGDATQLNDLSVMGVVVLSMQSDQASSFALLDRLQDVHWQAHNPAARPLVGLLRVEGLRHALTGGDAAHAALYRADLAKDSLTYVVSQGDGELSDGAVAPINVAPVLAGEIRDTQAYVVNSPTELMVLQYLINLERAGNQSNLALTQLNGILELADKYGIQNFQNLDSYPNLLAVKAELLADLGRFGEVDKAYSDGAARLTPLGQVDLNLSYMDYLIGRGNETAALNLLTKFVGVNLEQHQQIRLASSLACAYAYRGDEPHYAQLAAVLAQASMQRVRPALCAGDSDGAAAALIEAMKNDRSDAIMFLQNGDPRLVLGERDRAYQARVAALKARPDVVAAAKAANINIRTWPLRF